MQSASDQVKASPAPMVEQAGEVIQADRDAAADYWLAAFRHDSANLDAQFIREGRQDSKPLVQAFARHRLNTRPAPAETEKLAEEIYNLVYHHTVTKYDPAAGKRCIAARLTALSTPPADAGMLRELNLLREVEDAAADYCGRFMIDEAEDEDGSVCDEQQHLAAKRLCDALADFRAALNSQAHQIREGDHD